MKLILSKIPLPQSGEHLVAYRTLKTTYLFFPVQVVGRNHQIGVELRRVPDTDKFYLDVFIPVSCFESGHKLRDRKTGIILQNHKYPEIFYRSQPFTAAEWNGFKKNGKGAIAGQLAVMGKRFNLECEFAVEKIQANRYEISGSVKTKFSNFEMKPPMFLWGLESRVQDELELFFQFRTNQIKNYDFLS